MRPTYHRRIAPWMAARITALAALCVAALALSASAADASTLIVEGAGDGHGVGMSQDGAYGLARHGYAYQQILAHYYTGTTLGQAKPKTIIKVLVGSHVVKVPLERYVRGVVSAEMPSGWPAPALQAQAVASRTYAITAHAGGSRFDVYSDTRSQVYLGVAAETATTNAAVSATAGQVVLYAGKPAATYFFASSGGMTENIENSFIGAQPEPWLVGVADPYESSTSRWKLSIGLTTAAARFRGMVKGTMRGIEVLRRGASPRIVSAALLGSRGNTVVTGPELAEHLGLTSTWAYFSLRIGTRVVPEPDHSGTQHAPPAPTGPSPPPTGPQGGAQAPGTPPASVSGGVSAG